VGLAQVVAEAHEDRGVRVEIHGEALAVQAPDVLGKVFHGW